MVVGAAAPEVEVVAQEAVVVVGSDHPSEVSVQLRCAEIKRMPHAWQRRIVDRLNPQWLSMANELIAFLHSRDGIGEEGIVRLPESAHAAAPARGRWWMSAQERAEACWFHSFLRIRSEANNNRPATTSEIAFRG